MERTVAKLASAFKHSPPFSCLGFLYPKSITVSGTVTVKKILKGKDIVKTDGIGKMMPS